MNLATIPHKFNRPEDFGHSRTKNTERKLNMKTILKTLAPGMLACLAIFIGLTWSRAQEQPQPRRVQPQTLPAQVYAEQPQPVQQIIVCGNCGARIGVPQSVLIAQPIGEDRRQMPGQYFNGSEQPGFVNYPVDCDDGYYMQGAPPQSIFPLSTQWRIPANRIPGPRHFRRFANPGCGY